MSYVNGAEVKNVRRIVTGTISSGRGDIDTCRPTQTLPHSAKSDFYHPSLSLGTLLAVVVSPQREPFVGFIDFTWTILESSTPLLQLYQGIRSSE